MHGRAILCVTVLMCVLGVAGCGSGGHSNGSDVRSTSASLAACQLANEAINQITISNRSQIVSLLALAAQDAQAAHNLALSGNLVVLTQDWEDGQGLSSGAGVTMKAIESECGLPQS
jgi:hypothetical protein